jgi:amidohydrolase
MTLNESIVAAAASWNDELLALRRKLHAHPELAFEEHETARTVQAFLERLGLECRTGIAKTGIVATLPGARSGPTIAIRADMDALPIDEPAGLEFASIIPGRMHACGHDAHTAIALGVAAVLSGMRERLAGRAMFVFQPAEETLSGAAAMLEAGVFDDGAPDAMLGFHNWPQLRTGSVGWHPGPVMASSYAFDVTLRGVGGHGAHPHLAVDAIAAAAHFIVEAQTIVSREIAPIEPAVVTIGRVSGGTARNVIASSVELDGSVRTFDANVADAIERALRRMLEGIKLGMRVDYTLDWRKVAPVLRNDAPTMRRVLDAAKDALGADNVVEMPSPSMGSEDFAWFAERVPAAHLRIGSKIDGHDTAIHRSDYRLNEDAIGIGVRVMTRAVLALTT